MTDQNELLQQAQDLTPKQREGWVTVEREYELITSLFGGGVTPGENDNMTPIRGTEIRGLLRFWWRATRGGRFDGDLKKMKTAEDAIWGSAATEETKKKKDCQMPVQLGVTNLRFSAQDTDQPFIHEGKKSKPNPDSRVPAYAAFPLQRSEKELKGNNPPSPRTVLRKISFVLQLRFCAKHQTDVEAALWAWETFGGVGGRTRRGFGAIHCTSYLTQDGVRISVEPPIADKKAIEKVIKDKLKEVASSKWEWPEGVPNLASNMMLEIVVINGNEEKAWQTLIKNLRDFRQSREGNAYGPTHWPEANAVRTAAGKTVSSKSPDLGAKFPRAQLGLPILFHFPQDGTPDGTLKGATVERVASRLILKPLRCANGKAVGLAAVLKSPVLPDGESPVLEVGGKESVVAYQLSAAEAKKIVPLDDNGAETSLIKAFFNRLRSIK